MDLTVVVLIELPSHLNVYQFLFAPLSQHMVILCHWQLGPI
jgi:hypothetical protein